MEESNLILTPTDRIVLESYKSAVDGLSNYLGDGYELVLHSLENYEHSVIKIINGYHTGRAEGAPITDLALSMLAQIRAQGESCTSIAYFSKNRQGEPIKATTIPIIGEKRRIVGLLCINFYLNTPFAEVLRGYFPDAAQDHGSLAQPQIAETFVQNTNELIEAAVNQVRTEVLANPDIPLNNKNKEIVGLLLEKGIFRIKDAVVKTASLLGVSKNTVYLHIRNLTEK